MKTLHKNETTQHFDPSDNTVTHFTANLGKNDESDRYFITLYRFKTESTYGQTECNCTDETKARGTICHFCISNKLGARLQYRGPMGWRYYSAGKDGAIKKKLHPISELPSITGDNLITKTFNNSLYAG